MAHVVLKDLVKTYGSFKAVNDVSLTVNDGEFVALVGPSGCGKTTTLNLVAGLIPITSGDIVIGDRVVNDLDPKDRDIAMVFQNYALYPQKSVYKNLAFPLQMRKLPRDEIDKKVREAARVLDMTHLLERKPRELSGGQQQRVALGRALVRDPAVFLMVAFLVSENPVALVASYKIPAGTLPNVANRIKMARTSNVIVVVEAGGKLYSANKEVKVTVGGCGG